MDVTIKIKSDLTQHEYELIKHFTLTPTYIRNDPKLKHLIESIIVKSFKDIISATKDHKNNENVFNTNA